MCANFVPIFPSVTTYHALTFQSFVNFPRLSLHAPTTRLFYHISAQLSARAPVVLTVRKVVVASSVVVAVALVAVQVVTYARL